MKNLLGLGVDAAPDGLQLLIVGEEMKVSTDDSGNLLGFTKMVSKCDGETVLGDVSNGTTSLGVSPDSPGRIDPTSIRSVTILGNQL